MCHADLSNFKAFSHDWRAIQIWAWSVWCRRVSQKSVFPYCHLDQRLWEKRDHRDLGVRRMLISLTAQRKYLQTILLCTVVNWRSSWASPTTWPWNSHLTENLQPNPHKSLIYKKLSILSSLSHYTDCTSSSFLFTPRKIVLHKHHRQDQENSIWCTRVAVDVYSVPGDSRERVYITNKGVGCKRPKLKRLLDHGHCCWLCIGWLSTAAACCCCCCCRLAW